MPHMGCLGLVGGLPFSHHGGLTVLLEPAEARGFQGGAQGVDQGMGMVDFGLFGFVVPKERKTTRFPKQLHCTC